MTKSILLFANNYNNTKQEWHALADEKGYDLVVTAPKTHSDFLKEFENREVEVIANSGVGSNIMGGYPPEVIAEIPRSVKAIVQSGAGYDILGDISIWRARGIECGHTPTPVAPSTADTAVWLLFSALRDFYRLTTNLRQGNWTNGVPLAHDPEGHVVGIVGMGNIGRMIRDRLTPFGFKKIQYSNRSRLAPELEKDTEYVDYDTLLRTSDAIVFACPYNSTTHHLYNAEAIKKSKDGVVVINIARGGVLDEQALVDALDSGKIRSAGLDVFEHEPKVHPGLIANQNVMLLPHAATYTYECRRNVELEQIASCRSVIETGHVRHLVPGYKVPS